MIINADPPMKFDENYRECPMCFNCGWVQTTRHDAIGRQYRGVVKCRSCDYWPRRSSEVAEKVAAGKRI